MSRSEDLDETVKQVESLDRRIVATQADVREFEALRAALDDGVEQLGRLDIVAANAGIWSYGAVDQLAEQTWRDMLDVNLTGIWHTAKAAIPHLRAAGGGSIILTSSTLGLQGGTNVAHYSAAKHGMVGLMRSLALELAGDKIRVNTVHPTTVATPMLQNAPLYELFAPDLTEDERTDEALMARFQTMNALAVPWVESIDISNAVLWLASDEARYVTGVSLPVDAGQLLK